MNHLNKILKGTYGHMSVYGSYIDAEEEVWYSLDRIKKVDKKNVNCRKTKVGLHLRFAKFNHIGVRRGWKIQGR